MMKSTHFKDCGYLLEESLHKVSLELIEMLDEAVCLHCLKVNCSCTSIYKIPSQTDRSPPPAKDVPIWQYNTESTPLNHPFLQFLNQTQAFSRSVQPKPVKKEKKDEIQWEAAKASLKYVTEKLNYKSMEVARLHYWFNLNKPEAKVENSARVNAENVSEMDNPCWPPVKESPWTFNKKEVIKSNQAIEKFINSFCAKPEPKTQALEIKNSYNNMQSKNPYFVPKPCYDNKYFAYSNNNNYSHDYRIF